MESWVMRLKHCGVYLGGCIMGNGIKVEYSWESEALGQTFELHLGHRQDSGKGSVINACQIMVTVEDKFWD